MTYLFQGNRYVLLFCDKSISRYNFYVIQENIIRMISCDHHLNSLFLFILQLFSREF